MFLERFFVDGLAHASYMFGSGGVAAVVDPKRDVDDYLAAAARRGVAIRAIFETHPHADFVSGHVELSERSGAPIYVSKRAPVSYTRTPLHDRQSVEIGPLQVTALETPGHSPDSLSLLVEGEGRRSLFSGDTLFVGDVGRPDLRDDSVDVRSMAEALYRSLHEVLLSLPDDTIVYPAHGSGSLCGRNIGSAESTTIGAERISNWALGLAGKRDFVEAMISNLPDRPVYFAAAVEQNLLGAPVLASLPEPQLLTPRGVRVLTGATIVDLRPAPAFCEAHIARSLNIGIGSAMFSSWTGFFVRPESQIVLVASSSGEIAKARLDLARIGYDEIAGYIEPDPRAWRSAGLEVASIGELQPGEVDDWIRNGGTVVDVRSQAERDRGHVPGSIWLPLGRIACEPRAAPQGEIALICGSGYRSSIAASFLASTVNTRVRNVPGGWMEYSKRR